MDNDDGKNHSIFILNHLCTYNVSLSSIPILNIFSTDIHTTSLYVCNSPISLSTLNRITYVITLLFHLDCRNFKIFAASPCDRNLHEHPIGLRYGLMTYSNRLTSEQQSWRYITMNVSALICMFKAFVLKKYFLLKPSKVKDFV